MRTGRRRRSPLPEEHAAVHRGHDARPEVHVRRAHAVPAELQVVLEYDVREDRLDHVRREVPPRAAIAINRVDSIIIILASAFKPQVSQKHRKTKNKSKNKEQGDAPGVRAVAEGEVLEGRRRRLEPERVVLRRRRVVHARVAERVEHVRVRERALVVVHWVCGRGDDGAPRDARAVAQRDVLRGDALHDN